MSRREPRLSSLRLEAEGVLGAGAKKSVKQRWKNPQGFSQGALMGTSPPPQMKNERVRSPGKTLRWRPNQMVYLQANWPILFLIEQELWYTEGTESL
jgi:hypothetical protein